MHKNALYIVRLGPKTHFLRIEDVSEENDGLEQKYRLRIAPSDEGEGKTIRSSSELDAALCGAEFLLNRTQRHAEKILLSGGPKASRVH